MASKRRLRRKACEGKIRHASMEAAQKAGRHFRLHAYKCPHCSAYHTGHAPQRVRQTIAAGRERDSFGARMAMPE